MMTFQIRKGAQVVGCCSGQMYGLTSAMEIAEQTAKNNPDETVYVVLITDSLTESEIVLRIINPTF